MQHWRDYHSLICRSWKHIELSTRTMAQGSHSDHRRNLHDRCAVLRQGSLLHTSEFTPEHLKLLLQLEAYARSTRRSSLPFGGIQLIVSGDFFQLPPVTKAGKLQEKREKVLCSTRITQLGCISGATRQFCFQAASWLKCFKTAYLLKEVRSFFPTM